MKGYIYKITDKVNGLSYIGQTRYSVEFRWRQHLHSDDNTYFHRRLRKYGPDNFIVETLEECDVDQLNEREIFYIAKYNTFNEGYNLTIGGEGKRKIITDDQYDEIKGLYLSGFSACKIADLYNVDNATIYKILRIQGVKIRSNKLNINKQELQELISRYESGCSLRSLAKEYECSAPGLKEFLERNGVNIRKVKSILNDEASQNKIVNDYLGSKKTLKQILSEYHCSYNTLKNILSSRGINGGKYNLKLSPEQCLAVIGLFNNGMSVQNIANRHNVNKTTIYSILKKYNVNYHTV